jgi:hypothetical protein
MDLPAQRSLRFLVGLAVLALVAFGAWRGIAVLGRGPDPTRLRVWVLFKDVQGLQPGSRIVHRGMSVGEVSALQLDAAAGRVRVQIAVDSEAAALLTTTAQVWIVRPRFTGLARELTGLDTLIKESYLRLRARPRGEPLHAGEELLGLEGPPFDLAEEDLDDPMLGDLMATVVLPDAHGLRSGSAVLHRGIDCGEVRSVRLAAAGGGVVVRFRVRRAQRELVCERSRIWVARPILQGNLITGITVDSLGSVLAPALEFDTPADEAGEALADGASIVGLAAPAQPSSGWDGRQVKVDAGAAQPGARGTRPLVLSPWVEVRYRALEKDILGSDDELSASGEGVLFRDGKGELCALAARSACDADFALTGSFLDPLRVADERIRVVLQDGRVWPARRVWTAPEARDLVLLQVQVPAEAQALALPPATSYLDFDQQSELADPGPERKQQTLLKTGERAAGVLGQATKEATKRVTASFALLPAELRPGS